MTTIDLPLFSYDLVVVDPPWRWQAFSDLGLAKSPEAHYQTMTPAEVMALRVGDLLAPHGVVFLWCTWPLVAEGLHVNVLRAWGVVPKTGGVWAKRTASGRLRWGPGYLLRSVCEPFFIGTLAEAGVRGPGLPNLVETIETTAIDGLAREHSRKPDEIYALLEELSPGARRADLFSRQNRPGWIAWGLETGKFDEAAA